MTWDLHGFRLVTASAYPGMMAPLTGHPSCICVLSGDADRDGLAVASLSLEERDGVRRRWRFGDVAQLADFVPKVLAQAPEDDRPILLIPPRASVAWEAAAAAWPGRVRMTASPLSVVEKIAEDKIYVRDAVRRLGVPVPQELVLHPSELDFDRIAGRLRAPFVVQAPSGAGGQGTYLVSNPQDLALALTRQPHVDRWLVSAFAGDTTVNAAGVVHHDGVRLLPLSVQSSGIAELGFGFGGYCGSDFGAALPPRVVAKAQEIGAVVGTWLREQGHLGMFGVDIAVDGDELALLEVNPRIQGSSWLLSVVQRRAGLQPCLEQHVQALLGAPLGATLHEPDTLDRAGSHLLIRHRGRTGVVHALPATTGLPVTVTAMPALGTTVEPGAILARLEARHSLAAADGRSVPAATTSLVDAVLGGFEIVKN